MTPAPSRFTIDTKGGCALAAYVALCKSAPHAQRMYGGRFFKCVKQSAVNLIAAFSRPEKTKDAAAKVALFYFFIVLQTPRKAVGNFLRAATVYRTPISCRLF